MITYRFLTLASLALALPLAAAAPTVSEALEIREVFSFEKWVDSIIANPDTALSPEQAIEAWTASTNGTSSEALSKRAASCVGMADQAYVRPSPTIPFRTPLLLIPHPSRFHTKTHNPAPSRSRLTD